MEEKRKSLEKFSAFLIYGETQILKRNFIEEIHRFAQNDHQTPANQSVTHKFQSL